MTGQIPTGHVWLEGDNSLNSQDSRYYGPVPYALLVGRAWLQVGLPFGRLGCTHTRARVGLRVWKRERVKGGVWDRLCDGFVRKGAKWACLGPCNSRIPSVEVSAAGDFALEGLGWVGLE